MALDTAALDTAALDTAEAVYRAYNDAENAHDLAATERLVRPDLYVEVNGRPQLASAADDAEANAALLRCYPDYHRDLVEVVGTATRACVRWRMVGSAAPGLGLGPLDLHGCSVVEVADGRLARAYLYADGRVLEGLLERARDGATS
jgi:ketosteroid isomerase-like protein